MLNVQLVKNTTQIKSDLFGAVASGLCLIHCIATPFLFVAQTCSASCCNDAPLWWSLIDYFFLVVSFFAVKASVKNTSKDWMKYALWISWGLLFLVISSEKLALFALPTGAIYIPAFALVGLHLYNKRYCQCKKEECCAS